MRTSPSGRRVAVWPTREVLIDPVALKVPVLGSYSSALAEITGPQTLAADDEDAAVIEHSGGVAIAIDGHRAGAAEGAGRRVIQLCDASGIGRSRADGWIDAPGTAMPVPVKSSES